MVFLLLPEFSTRLAEERRPLLLLAFLVLVPLAGIASASFYGELRRRSWRYLAHGALLAMMAAALWTYWPKS